MRQFLFVSACVVLLAGCGGGGGSHLTNGGGGGTTGTVTLAVPDPIQNSSGTPSSFHVDVNTGLVTQNGAGAAKSRVAFSGTTVTYNTNTLLDQPGGTGIKVLGVSLTNNWGLPLGVDPNGNVIGINVVFSPITNVGTFPDVRNLAQVSTLAGIGTSGSVNGGNSGSSFNGPTGVAVAGQTVYVADYNNNRIRQISSGVTSLLAGSGGGGGTNGTGASATFYGPHGVTVGPDGAIYVAESVGNRIRRITPQGAVTTVAGTGTASAVNGAGGSATFNGPKAIAFDASGNMYVTDGGNDLIRKIAFTGTDRTNPASYTVSTLAGTGTAGAVDGTGTSASFNSPIGIAAGTNGLYVTDQNNNRIRSVSYAGAVVTIAGTGTAGSADGTGSVATLNAPRGITLVNGSLLVVCAGTNSIRQISPIMGASQSTSQGWQTSTIAGAGTSGATDGAGNVAQFNSPYLMASDVSGNLYVADFSNDKIRKVSPSSGNFPVGVPVGTPPAEPVQVSNATGFNGSQNPFISYPGSLASGATSPSQNWNFTVPAGVTSFDFTVTASTATTVQASPNGADPTSFLSVFAGNGSNGFENGTGAAAAFGEFPVNLSNDSLGYTYLSDINNVAIRVISPSGTVGTIAGGPGLTSASPSVTDGLGTSATLFEPVGTAATADGSHVYFVDGSLIRVATLIGSNRLSAASWSISTIAGTAGAGLVNGLGSAAKFNNPIALAVDATGDVYVTDEANNVIREMHLFGSNPALASNWIVSTFAGSGTAGFLNGSVGNAKFNAPFSISIDPRSNIFVIDANNRMVRKISGGMVTTLAGTGASGSADGPGSSATFESPYALAVDSSGYLYLVDSLTSRFRKISPTGVVSTLNVTTLTNTYGIGVNSAGDLLLSSTCQVNKLERQFFSGTQ